MRKIEFRHMVIEDYKQINSLWKSDINIGYSESDTYSKINEFLLRNPHQSFVACDGKKIVGTVLVGHDGRKGIINHLYVIPEYRNRHIAKELLKMAEQCLEKNHIYNSYVFVKKNNLAKEFWLKEKYVEQVDFVVLKKKLDHSK